MDIYKLIGQIQSRFIAINLLEFGAAEIKIVDQWKKR